MNVLAAGSKEGAADVSAQAASIKNAGVAASGAGVSIEQLQGTIQMLAEKDWRQNRPVPHSVSSSWYCKPDRMKPTRR